VEIGRQSDLYLSAQIHGGAERRQNGFGEEQSLKVTDVRVGGSTVLVAKGQLFLP
jgi:hypothetical protein